MSQKLVVVVAGGKGKQGGAVVKSLLEQGHTWGISRTMFASGGFVAVQFQCRLQLLFRQCIECQ
jgi:nucleoside-diphosphate-sugar epimerase